MSHDVRARLAAALPLGIALLAPLLPLLVLLANVLPPDLPIAAVRPTALAVAIVVGIAAAVSAGALGGEGVTAFIKPPLALPLYAFIVAQLLAALHGIDARDSSLAIVAQTAAALAYLAAYRSLADDYLRRAYLGVFFVSGIVACAFAVGLALTKNAPAFFAFLHGRAAGSFLQPNEFAGYLLFLIPLGVTQLAGPRSLAWLGTAAAALGVVGLALSASRSAWLGLAIGASVLVARFGRRAALAYALAVAVLIAVGVFSPIANVAHDPSENASRIMVWRGAARMVQRFALTGIGPAAFAKAYPAYKMPDATADEVHAHDVPLNVLVEDGILGFGAFAWLVVACVASARKSGLAMSRQFRSDGERTWLYAGLGAAFAASAVQNLTDDVTTFTLILWWPMIGLMTALGKEPNTNAARDGDAANVADRASRVSPECSGPSIARSHTFARTIPMADRASRGPIQSHISSAAFTIALALALAGCSHAAAPPSPSPHVTPSANVPNIASVTAHGAGGKRISIQDVENSRPVYILEASNVAYLPGREQGTFSDTRLVFYKGGAERLTVTAPSAVLNLKAKGVTLRGGVRARSSAGDSLSADQIAYDDKHHQLIATGNVVAVDANGTTISGDRAIADLDLQEIKIFGHIGMTGH